MKTLIHSEFHHRKRKWIHIAYTKIWLRPIYVYFNKMFGNFFSNVTGYYLRCCKTVWNSNVLQCVSLAIVIVLLTNLIQRKDKVIFTTNKLWHSRYHFEFMQSGFYRFWFVMFFLSVKQAKNNVIIIQIFEF